MGLINNNYICLMKPVIVYFVDGDIIGEHIVAMEEVMKSTYPDRTVNVIHVEDEEEKYEILSEYNIEEMDSYLANTIWQSIEDYDENSDT